MSMQLTRWCITELASFLECYRAPEMQGMFWDSHLIVQWVWRFLFSLSQHAGRDLDAVQWLCWLSASIRDIKDQQIIKDLVQISHSLISAHHSWDDSYCIIFSTYLTRNLYTKQLPHDHICNLMSAYRTPLNCETIKDISLNMQVPAMYYNFEVAIGSAN